MFQGPANRNLKARTKGQRLTLNEKKEILNQISTGIPIRVIKELFQISDSTI